MRKKYALFASRHLVNQSILSAEGLKELERLGVEWDRLVDLRTSFKKAKARMSSTWTDEQLATLQELREAQACPPHTV